MLPPGKLVEVGVDLPQIHPKPIHKSAMSRDKENRVTLVTVLLCTAVCNLVPVTRSDHLLQNQALALLKAKSAEEHHNGDGLPDEPVGGLHVPQHEGLELRFIEDGGLGFDVGVEPLDQHGEARQLLQLDVILVLHDAVQAGVRGPQSTRSELLFLPQKVEKQGEGIPSRGASSESCSGTKSRNCNQIIEYCFLLSLSCRKSSSSATMNAMEKRERGVNAPRS